MWSGEMRCSQRRGRLLWVPTFSSELIKNVQRRPLGRALTYVAPRRAWPNRAARTGLRLVLHVVVVVVVVAERGKKVKDSRLSISHSSGAVPRPT